MGNTAWNLPLLSHPKELDRHRVIVGSGVAGLYKPLISCCDVMLASTDSMPRRERRDKPALHYFEYSTKAWMAKFA